MSGSTANLIDRVQTGKVIDFFDFGFGAIFNVADVAIVSGMLIMIYIVTFRMDDDERARR